MEKSPLLANGYNAAPPTHLNPMQFMALNHAAQQAAAAAAAQHALLGSPAGAMQGGLPTGLSLATSNHSALTQSQASNLTNYASLNGGAGHGLISRAESEAIKGHTSAPVDPMTAARYTIDCLINSHFIIESVN